ncbi:LuxR C-terminal-related transcriptional regulator [Streptomyces sp. MAR4 CNX-425]|uniref:response regulator transcription factor n=1 Tax=Streptomyces sp. MAR4 CNX-425 TaxID=3406343 RepID=UPI003B512B80
MLADDRGICAVAERGAGEETLLVRHTRVDVLVVCSATARAALCSLRRTAAVVTRRPAVVTVLAQGTADDVRSLLASGARGVLRSGSAAEHLPWAVHAASRGAVALDPVFATAVVAAYVEPVRAGLQQDAARRRLAALSRREGEVLRLAAQGLDSRDIAVQLGVARVTVKAHLRNAYARLGVTGRLQAARIAWEAEPEDRRPVLDLGGAVPPRRGDAGGADIRAAHRTYRAGDFAAGPPVHPGCLRTRP